jgi:sulfite reductase alpha subunit-like flavoprotein
VLAPALQGCKVYSFSGAATTAKTIAVDPFFNNTDLAPANMGQTFTNRVKDYYQQNSSLRVVPENGELHIEGIVSEYRINPIAPVANTDPNQPQVAALSRLTIAVKITYEDTLEPKNSFKDRSFSFYRDFDNNLNFTSIQEDLERRIIDQILIDIFNATVANW